MLINLINTVSQNSINFIQVKKLYKSLYWYHKPKYNNFFLYYKEFKNNKLFTIIFFNQNIIQNKSIRLYYSNKFNMNIIFFYINFIKNLNLFYIYYYYYFINNLFFYTIRGINIIKFNTTNSNRLLFI